ncbi:hypothetical protein [Kineosporia sp. NBRC 101731]|uniref:hypothetical protein n=1 Tax=Kineosporia sp. NBRC 101731 TaxID=3032199 RepID=UPI00249FEB72|nr:hypothetical protein [Kineosporia sp. NBRC 101731]GLY30292.1 hypothetical protein Kisp02_36570 [Kineosporia sp. NBRC 101731]
MPRLSATPVRLCCTVLRPSRNRSGSRTTTPGRAVGYAAAWDNTVWTAIGPLVAPDTAVARALVADLARSAPGPVRLDILVRTDPALSAWLTANGLTEIMRATLMVRGDDLPPGNGSYLAPLMQSLG